MHEVIRGFLSVKKRQEGEGGFEDFLFCCFFAKKNLSSFFFFLICFCCFFDFLELALFQYTFPCK